MLILLLPGITKCPSLTDDDAHLIGAPSAPYSVGKVATWTCASGYAFQSGDPSFEARCDPDTGVFRGPNIQTCQGNFSGVLF